MFEDNDLTQFAPGLEVIEVPGDHDSMVLEPNVRVLAARLKELLAALDARERAGEQAGGAAGSALATAAE